MRRRLATVLFWWSYWKAAASSTVLWTVASSRTRGGSGLPVMFAGALARVGPPEPFPHPFCGSGEEFAHGHIVPLAQNQQIMAPEGGGVHNPGLAHQGFAVCNPSGRE